MTTQVSLFDEPGANEPSPARVRTLAQFLAGWRWPGHGSYQQLSAKRRTVAEEAARAALAALATGDEDA